MYLSTKHLKSSQPSKKSGPQFAGPSPITKVINPVSIQLQLPKNMRRVDFLVGHGGALDVFGAPKPVPAVLDLQWALREKRPPKYSPQ